MFNYLKWELKDYLGTKYKWFAMFGIIYLLVLIISNDGDGFLVGLVGLLYSIALISSLLGTYFAGTKHAVNTFNKKTFLLESMIPTSAKKILLAKYILGIIINFIYLLLVVLGLITIMIKGFGVSNTLEFLQNIIDITDPVKLFEGILLLICSSVAFLSVVVLCFVGAKAMNPAGKHDKVVGFILAVIVLYIVSYLVSSIISGTSSTYLTDLIYIIISTIAFFITSYLVENKLEIYS